ncbi:MAG: hypothetical protein K0S11_1538 [Gammaproteobacteria bacterium]|jgi:hypothetical protein|nr:hypothetical protein [Gammaproteobacteria bacterium]
MIYLGAQGISFSEELRNWTTKQLIDKLGKLTDAATLEIDNDLSEEVETCLQGLKSQLKQSNININTLSVFRKNLLHLLLELLMTHKEGKITYNCQALEKIMGLIKKLMSLGIERQQKDMKGITPVTLAAQYGDLSLLQNTQEKALANVLVELNEPGIAKLLEGELQPIGCWLVTYPNGEPEKIENLAEFFKIKIRDLITYFHSEHPCFPEQLHQLNRQLLRGNGIKLYQEQRVPTDDEIVLFKRVATKLLRVNELFLIYIVTISMSQT